MSLCKTDVCTASFQALRVPCWAHTALQPKAHLIEQACRDHGNCL